MIRVLGSPKRLCDGLTRRDLLHVGLAGPARARPAAGDQARAGTALASATAADVRPGEVVHPALPLRLAQPARDVRPQARRPAEIRGELGSIRSTCRAWTSASCCPHLARVMDKVTVVRSVTHPYPLHGVAFATTGIPTIDAADGAEPARPGALAVHRLGRRLPRRGTRRRRARQARGAAQPRPALGLQQPARRRGAPRRPLRRRSSARRTTRSGPSSSARGREGARRRSPAQTWDDFEPYRGHHPREPVPPRVGLAPRPRADARPPRPPPLAARAVRAGAPRARRGRPVGRASTATGRWPTRCSARSGSGRRSTSTASRPRPASCTA